MVNFIVLIIAIAVLVTVVQWLVKFFNWRPFSGKNSNHRRRH